MIMDTLAGIAFSYEPALEEYMMEPPKKKTENVINKYMYGEILFTGIYSSLLCIVFLKNDWIKSLYRSSPDNKYLMTAFFTLFIFSGIFNSFNARTNRINILANINRNKVFILIIIFIIIVQLTIIYFGGTMFRSFGLLPNELIITLLFALTVIPVDWFRKIYLKRKNIDNKI